MSGIKCKEEITIRKAIETLESLRKHCKDYAETAFDNELWANDVVALKAGMFALEILAGNYPKLEETVLGFGGEV